LIVVGLAMLKSLRRVGRKFRILQSYSIPEAGAQIGLSRAGSYRAADLGDIPTEKIGKKLLRVPRAKWDRIRKQLIARERELRAVRKAARPEERAVSVCNSRGNG
jgi:hypothetical protein